MSTPRREPDVTFHDFAELDQTALGEPGMAEQVAAITEEMEQARTAVPYREADPCGCVIEWYDLPNGHRTGTTVDECPAHARERESVAEARERRAAYVEECCEVMHDAYERAAVGAGWETQKASRKPWAEVPQANKETMRAAVRALLGYVHFNPPEDPR